MIYIYMTFLSAAFASLSDFFSYSRDSLGKSASNNYLENGFSKFFIVLSFLVLFLLSGIRYEVGSDYNTYATQMVSAVVLQSSQTEILFRMLIKLSIWLGSYQYVFILSSFLIVLFVFKAIRDQSNSNWQSVVIFVFSTFYAFSMNGIRQAIGTAIFLYAFKFIKSEKPIKYFFWIIIATGFHSSALIYLAVYFLKYLKKPKHTAAIITVILTIISYVLRSEIRTVLYIIVNKFTNYGRYFGSDFDNTLATMNTIFLLLNVVITITIGYCMYKNKDYDDKLNELIILQLLITVFSGFSFSIPAAFRVFYMFVPLQIILVPNIIRIVRAKVLLSTFILIMYLSIFYVFILHSNYNQVLPYQVNEMFIKQLMWGF